jgi:hypothetical protein
MKQSVLVLAFFTVLATAGTAPAQAIRARLSGSEEVPAVITAASGDFRGTIARNQQSIDYTLTYNNLQAPVRQAHIHIGQPDVNGGIVVWLCQTAENPAPAGTAPPLCPQSGSVSGTILPADVLPQLTQGVADDRLDLVIAAIRAGLAYVNVHTAQSPGGEIRGQLRRGN